MSKKLFRCRNCEFETEYNNKFKEGLCETCCNILDFNDDLIGKIVPGVIVNLITKYIDKKFAVLAKGDVDDTTVDDLVEDFAHLAHQSWSGWTKYMLGKCLDSIGPVKINGALIIPEDSVKRWTRQMNTNYEDLPESEKESDRKEARIYLNAIFGADAKRGQ